MAVMNGDLVRFAHERDGGPVHRIVGIAGDGMVELHDMGGLFAPHLFEVVTYIAGIAEVDDPLIAILNRFHRNACYPEAMPHEVRVVADEIRDLLCGDLIA
jgi:hypothetical protein